MRALEVSNLSFSYDGKHDAVNDVSFSVERGKYVAIIGHNGSGKSTLAKLIIGLLSFKKGEVKVFDEVLTMQSVHAIRARIGIVFQNPDNQFIGATVKDDIAFGLENRRVPHEDMEDIIQKYAAKVHMSDFLESEPANLSGGQKQRVAIAGILAMTPDLVILDEATSMLDPKGKREVKETLSLMREENPNLTILSITHDIEEATISDEVIVMNQGRIVISGTPLKVFSQEDVLKKIDLDLPFVQKLKKALKLRAIDVDNLANLEEMADFLCR
ncbi:MAG: energy-coupling factor transporter ATPase [Bacilli bacterium]|jgi:energy-coupling factor transport system ATP-binding protein